METAILQRLSVLEDAFRRSENTTSHILTRIKEIELAINNLAKSQEMSSPELHYLREEIQQLKRQTAHIDSSWRQANAEMANSVQQDLRARLPQQIDAIHGQLRAEQSAVRHDVSEVQLTLRRLAEQFVSDQADVRSVLSATKWTADQLQAVTQQHRDGIVALEKRVDGAHTHLREFQVEVERNAATFRDNVEQAVRAAHSDTLQRIDSEARAREALQVDVQAALSRLRDDAVRGFANSAALSRVLEDNLTSLETVLRAEVRSRMTNSDEGQRAMMSIQQQIANLTSRLGITTDGSGGSGTPRGAQAGRNNDLNGTINSNHEAGGGNHHTKAQLDRLWAELHHVKIQQHDTMERVLRLQHSGGVTAAPPPPRGPTGLSAIPSPPKGGQQKATQQHSAAASASVSGDGGGALSGNGANEDELDRTLFDAELLDENNNDAATSSGGETTRYRLDGCLAAISKRLTQKASIALVQRLRTELDATVERRVDHALQDIQQRLERDQSILELQLQKLKEELEHQFHSLQTTTVEHRVVARSRSSSSASSRSRSSSRSSTNSSRNSESVRKGGKKKKTSAHTTPRINVMERLN